MSVQQMKAYILSHYPKWFKVLSMPDRQVIAIYYRMRRNTTT